MLCKLAEHRKVYKACIRKYTMVDEGIRVDEEVKRFLDDKKLVPRESYKSVLKRLLGIRKNGKG